ncbi:trimethylamine methyltransferase family protein [Halofilum ochraceum]|uniref:trimethylamine methyltransferase family protein n=1 Tax=Halofilum ochraceum TaxID=1611323 RepID=UPI000829CD40|nr:trimethylamine methyltransferase family protein [Halofilum ochraceum]
MTEQAVRSRRGGRAARRSARTEQREPMLPALERQLPTVDALSDEGVERLHDASMRVLENTGIDFRDPVALEDWRQAGAEVDGQRVRIPRGLIMEKLRTVPERIRLHARDPAKSVELGGNSSIFVPMTGAPFIRDLDDKRRSGTIADLNNFHRLAHMESGLHSSAHVICEPMDIPVGHRHLWITYSSMAHSDKTFMGMSTTRTRAEDVMEMVKILFGADYVEDHPVVTGNINGNSPLVWDESMLGALRAFSRHNQPVLCSPFVLGGANTPAHTLASVAQLNAEAVAALAYTQIVRPGAPAIYGHYLSTVSMRSGAPMAGTPEISQMNFLVGQMARYYGVPWRTSGSLGGAKTFDAQAGYESASTLTATILAGANYVWHAAGWNEAGMHCSMAKFVVDAEQCAMAHKLGRGAEWDDFEEALATIDDVGPGGHFLGTEYTQKNFQRAFFIPNRFDNDNYEQWAANGEQEITARALNYARNQLNEYEQPALDPAVDEALRDYIARREREIDPNEV